jgi:hypothetical protein
VTSLSSNRTVAAALLVALSIQSICSVYPDQRSSRFGVAELGHVICLFGLSIDSRRLREDRLVSPTQPEAVLCDKQASTPGGHDHASGLASVASSFDLAQDLAVEGRVERNALLAERDKEIGSRRLFIQRVGANNLVAEQPGASTGRGRSEALDRAEGDVDATVDRVVIDVAQDVGALTYMRWVAKDPGQDSSITLRASAYPPDMPTY